MEALVNKLAMWQAERKKVEDIVSNDLNVINGAKYIEELEAEITETRKSMVFLRAGYDERISEIDDEIKHVSSQIVEAWDGDKKTMPFDAGTLKFRTTQSLKIGDGAALLAQLLHHFSTNVVVDEYISGFNRTAIKKFMDLIPTLPDVAELIPKTTVKMEQKE